MGYGFLIRESCLLGEDPFFGLIFQKNSTPLGGLAVYRGRDKCRSGFKKQTICLIPGAFDSIMYT